jgi:UDP-N-acetylglucosamine transferase subunit ALG13
MIFVTVGAQRPFDRMVQAIDQWAGAHSYGDIFAQIGPAQYRPQHMPWTEFLDAAECRRKMEHADAVVAHAAMGSILTALELGKPILVLPRRADLGEDHDDIQLITAQRLVAQGRVIVAQDVPQLLEKLAYFRTLGPAERRVTQAAPALLAALRAFIASAKSERPAHLPAPEAVSANRGAPVQSRNGSRHGTVNGAAVESPAPPTTAPVDRAPAAAELSRPAAQTYPAAHIQAHLRAMIMLAGRLRYTDLGRRAGRSRLDLPIDQERSILAFWRDQAIDLATVWNTSHLPMRVLLDQASPMPTLPPVLPGVTISLERDQLEYRGTGGVLRDACADYADDDWVLVANAAQLLFGSLRNLADQLAAAGGEINVIQDSEGIPNGLILLRCGVLRAIPEIGFHDMKEQVVPALARTHRVKVVATRGLTSRPIHSLQDFTETLRAYHAGRSPGPDGAGLAHERWQTHFSICEPGSEVAPTAIVRDAVILRGAVVEKGAVVVRSVVVQGARVRAGEKVFDQIVT